MVNKINKKERYYKTIPNLVQIKDNAIYIICTYTTSQNFGNFTILNVFEHLKSLMLIKATFISK